MQLSVYKYSSQRWAPGGWRRKRLALIPEFPRAQHRARYRLGGCLGYGLHKQASISAIHTLFVNFINKDIGPFPRQQPGSIPGWFSAKCFAFSAFFTSPCTIFLGPVVLVCLVFFQADRCMGSRRVQSWICGYFREGA